MLVGVHLYSENTDLSYSLPLSSTISQKAGEDLRVLFLLDATCIVQDDTEVVYILSEVAGADLNLAI